MNNPSKLNTRPAPREIQTENSSPLRPASRGSDACLYLSFRQHPEWTGEREGVRAIPSKTKQEKVDGPKYDVEGQFRYSKLLLDQRAVAHLECRRGFLPLLSPTSELLSRPATYGRLVITVVGDDLENVCVSWRESQASRPRIPLSLITIFYTGQETRQASRLDDDDDELKSDLSQQRLKGKNAKEKKARGK